ncbi:MAG: polysaccharide biosynthesis/export family protein [Deltaproteobacteria bacterium]|nr:polysaccharide biosynthesis/export family protein [Deltaproteobacteria bacterium]
MRMYAFIGCALALLLCNAGCSATGGDIVKVVSVSSEKGSLPGLKDADLAKVQQIRQSAAGGAGDADVLRRVLAGKIRSITVAEYMRLYPEAVGSGTRDYIVGGGDVLAVKVYEEPDLSRDAVRVSADGYLSFPLISRLRVEGLSTAEIGELISRKFSEGQYLLNAHVAVVVTEYNSKQFMVLGAVASPGSYPLTAHERILNAISKAGGIKETGAGKRAKIVRMQNAGTAQEKQIVIDVDLQGILRGTDQYANLQLRDKDTLFIPTAESFYIIGQVNKPGPYPLIDRELTLVEGIGIAGGFTNIAARNSTRIIRTENGQEKVLEVRVDDITKAGKKIRDVIIQPNDIIIVPESFF